MYITLAGQVLVSPSNTVFLTTCIFIGIDTVIETVNEVYMNQSNAYSHSQIEEHALELFCGIIDIQIEFQCL